MGAANPAFPRPKVDIDVRRSKITRILYRVALYVVVIAGAILFGLPFVWMIRTTIMPSYQVNLFPPQWIQKELDLHFYPGLFRSGLPFARWLWNSFVLSTLTAFGAMLSSAIVAFAFARLRFRGREALFIVVLATMIMPWHVRLIPTYLLFSRLGWIGSYKPLVLPTFFAPAFSVFLLRQFFMQIPREMDDAAYIDGCSPLGLFARIHIPLSLPALGVVMIFQFNGMWNDFLGPLLYLRIKEQYPIAVGLQFLQGQYKDANIQMLMVGSLISIIPPITLFFFTQRQMIQGIVITGIKG